jgi:hypothetical protein
LLGAGLHEAEECITAVAARVRAGAAGDFAPGDVGADVVFRAVGVERNIGPLQHSQQVGFLGMQPFQQPVERHVVGLGREDPVKPGCQLRLGLGRRRCRIGLQTGIEFPDAITDRLLCDAAVFRESIEFVDEPFGMHPAQCMLADVELTGAVGDDNGVIEQALG